MLRKRIIVMLITSLFVSLNLSVPWQVREGMAATYTPHLIGQVQGEGVVVHKGQPIAIRGNTAPLFSGGQVQTTARAVQVRLADGSRLDLLPYGAVAIQQGPEGLQAHVGGGRIFFRMGSDSRLVLITPTARLEPIGDGVKQGELFVDARGVSSLQMAEGMLRTVEQGTDRVLVASRDPVFIPRKPTIEGPIFVAQLIVPAPGLPEGVTPLYDPSGKNIGYLKSDGTFVSAPGAVPDLAGPIPESTLASVLPDLPAEATAAFTAEGEYVGYLKAGAFASVGGISTTALVVLGAIPLIVGGAIGIGGISGGGGGAPATPVSP